MTACKITAYTVSIGSSQWAGTMPASTRAVCETHGWQFACAPISVPTVGPAASCPLGRIEQATEEALRRIEKALEGKG